MPRTPPPASCPGIPRRETLAVGTLLWRVHHRARSAIAMNSTPQPAVTAGGRFDSLTGDYSYLYLGGSPEAAVAETICRDLPLDDPAARMVPRARIRDRILSAVVVTRSIRVVVAHGAALAQLGQDPWLTKCTPRDYLLTRAWARSILSWAPESEGLVYRSRHNEDLRSWVLTGPPQGGNHPRLELHGSALDLDSPVGRAYLRRVLVAYNAGVAR